MAKVMSTGFGTASSRKAILELVVMRRPIACRLFARLVRGEAYSTC